MSVQVVAQGVLLGTPEMFDSERGPEAAVGFGTRQAVNFEGQELEIDAVPTGELSCGGEPAKVLMGLEKGNRVEIRGEMVFRSNMTAVVEGRSDGRVTFRAETVARLD